MTTDKDFEQFEDDNDVDDTAEPKKAPAKKAPAKRAPAKKSASKKEPAAEPERDQETAEAADDARVDEATSDDDSVELVIEKTVEVNEPVLKNGSPAVVDGKVQQKAVERKLTFATKIPRNIGEWDGRVMRRFAQGRDEEGLIFLLGDAEFDRYLDIMQPKHKDVAPPLMSALTKALGLGTDSGN
ncbi:hypothetical protein QSJ19_00980 [Gordonia sp. ABSL11-1]|uniref:hypothetical protein n=1 Tax=Gordonia sp. ABSL11-1 TaxID=3053924 RepID=UPI002573E901|nr:hypothetical protein [Gordonia sp. ABSL11-1]MDL9944175.1 hypothetical protein [Gordonia sp. ABSL11-1]